MRVIIFGSNGMLGNYLYSFLKYKSNMDIISFSRKNLDICKTTKETLHNFLEPIVSKDDSVIINAAGVIKQREKNIEEMIFVNSIFPHMLANLSKNLNFKCIHITTDCVFAGDKGKYTEKSPHDCLDAYGKSKSLGENPNSCVIRTSIIGDELYNKKSLLEWCVSMRGKEINGYTNHFWNGVTCLELSSIIKKIINKNFFWEGVRHIFSEDVSKFELIQMINFHYNLNLNIKKYETKYPCDRTLRTNYKKIINKSLEQQIIEMKKFSKFLINKKMF